MLNDAMRIYESVNARDFLKSTLRWFRSESMALKSHAILMYEYGPPSGLKLADISMPFLKSGDVRIRSIVSAVNHSDIEIRAGKWRMYAADPFPLHSGC
jgi:hypothetical protein